jgi:hypothetical protein
VSINGASAVPVVSIKDPAFPFVFMRTVQDCFNNWNDRSVFFYSFG